MENSQLNQQIIALAGCSLAAKVVSQLAHKGWTDDNYLQTAMNGVLNLEPADAEQVVGSLQDIKMGFTALLEQLYPKGDRDMDIGRYMANLISLQSQFLKSDELIQIVRTRLKQITRQQQLYNKSSDETVDAIASLYQDTLSTLPLKIQVTGQAKYLQQEAVQKQVRTMLFFGLRCAVMWKQLGGRKRDFLFRRRHIADAINRLDLSADNL